MPNPFKADGEEGSLVPLRVVKAVLYANAKYIWGFSLDETGSAAVELEFRNGSATGDIVAWVNINADKTANMSYVRPLHFPAGLHIKAVTGAFQGVVYL